MLIDIITIFPRMFAPVLNESIIKRAQEKRKVKVRLHDLRDYTADKHRKVDDRPFGGGAGMLMRPEPIFKAVECIMQNLKFKVKKTNSKIILLCPQGKTLTHRACKRLSKYKHLILICGHYEGVDERVRRHLADEEISIGDYILTGGELPAMVLIDALVRLLPGVLGDKNSLNFESFEDNLLEYPQFSRPASFKGLKVPPVLLSGDHKRIEAWRRKEAIKKTRSRRPDLLK
ncbi:MAG: tRNA (guanosine(37)-N1)-methyltransferase TrmD [Candidatus Omnitrophica bacterium]|nr:tRNA (guanosine(37)-N1)-methyltransferase TrmD [Candidatus Omnitrophota bacterium]MBL7151385.1 tRNA (guanosine(37)-N1)-methyltransferase TrmD [Candidatus Omnitrophota bacterium]MBL7210260.1 tRNA (guanosine(37)-N1)-methyltransferase TrmD [Candidatus Omnitrophota bacterium]